jgi:hypothetical protein
MRATKIEVRTAALRAGRMVDGKWEPAGQLVATLWLQEAGEDLAKQIAWSIKTLPSASGTSYEEVVATVEGRQEMPSE